MKLHTSMKVEDLSAAVAFYSSLFAQSPTVVREDYVKWDVAEPAVNFVVETGEGRIGLDHVGIQAATREELDAVSARMRGSGNAFLDVGSANCCYANMDKAWVKGAAGEKWEAFLTHSQDQAEYGEDTAHLLDEM